MFSATLIASSAAEFWENPLKNLVDSDAIAA